ncbi:MAG: DNA polymerase I [Chloroflexi bacterium ADurb.Bin360]|nr:MAG: DNA polymerase I [Chloroflexi bacterium ADurb.Bin360]
MVSQKLLLVDGHSLAYRAFHALPPDLQTSKGELTNAVFGFASMLLSVLLDERPDYAIVTFDKGPSFRVREYSEYKAHREKMPDAMRGQMQRVRDFVTALGMPLVELDDFEADDLLGTLSRQAAALALDVVIVTGDRDALQLVDEHVTVLTSGRRFSDTLRFDPQAVREKTGLEPGQLVDLKALIGDKSDNIPGVRGVGEKGATDMLQQYGSLEGVYTHLEALPPRYQQALVEGRDSALLSQHLGRIVRDTPVTLDLPSAAAWRHTKRSSVVALLQELEFRSLLGKVAELPVDSLPEGQLSLFDAVDTATAQQLEPTPAPAVLGHYQLVRDEVMLKALVDRLRAEAKHLAIDTETTGTDALQAQLVGISLTHIAGEAWYIPLVAPAGEPILALEAVSRHLGSLLADPELPKLGHNLKFDAKVLRRAGLPLAGLAFDTMLAEWLINPDSPNLGLKNLAWARLGIQMTEITALIGTGKEQKSMDAVPLVQVTPYAGADVDMCLRLEPLLRAELASHAQEPLLRDLEMPLIEVLADMETVGVCLDLGWLQTLSAELAERLAHLESDIYELAGGSFNINSTQQLSVVLFERLGLPARGVKKLQSGHYSTRAEVLETLRGSHSIVERILEHRELSKLKSTYVDALPALLNPETGRVHTSYNQIGTVTGRLSSSNPNLQNIPIRTEEGRRVRRAFAAPEGYILVGADYSQVELRVMAHVSQDPALISAFMRDEDIHARTAASVFGVPLSEVTYDMRRIAKAVNFGLIYGQGAFGLSGQIGVSVPKAEDFISRYFAQFPKVRAFMEQVQRDAAQNGYVETLLKRRRYFPELAPDSRANVNQRQAAQRMAINTPIQGTAADIIKLAMLRLHAALLQGGLRSRLILQVHDELVVETPKAEVPQVVALVRECMEKAFELRVPLKVDVEVGVNWEDMQPWK